MVYRTYALLKESLLAAIWSDFSLGPVLNGWTVTYRTHFI
jgi:hypothetical protein